MTGRLASDAPRVNRHVARCDTTRRPATGLADTQEDPTGCARACQEWSCDASCPQPVLWPTGNTHLNVRKPGRLHQKTNERNDAASVDQTATDDTAARRQWRQILTVGFRADDGATR